MQRLRLTLGVAIFAILTVLAPSPTQAYPAFTCTISLVSVVGGEDATVTATIDPETDVDFRLTYRSQVHTDDGVTTTTATFETPEVDHPTNTIVEGTATVEGGDSVPCTGTIRLLPDDDDDDDDDGDGDGDGDDGDGAGDGDNGGLLPNTGGERLAWLIIGIMLVLAGSGAVVASRRRET